jgi:hypothetical protein
LEKVLSDGASIESTPKRMTLRKKKDAESEEHKKTVEKRRVGSTRRRSLKIEPTDKKTESKTSEGEEKDDSFDINDFQQKMNNIGGDLDNDADRKKAGREQDDVKKLEEKIQSLHKRHSQVIMVDEEKSDAPSAPGKNAKQTLGKSGEIELSIEEKLMQSEKEKSEVLKALALLVGKDRIADVLKDKVVPETRLAKYNRQSLVEASSEGLWKKRMERDRNAQSARLKRMIHGEKHARHPKRWGQSKAVSMKRSPTKKGKKGSSPTARQYTEKSLNISLYDALKRSQLSQAHSTDRIDRIKDWAISLLQMTGETPSNLVKMLEQVDSSQIRTEQERSPRAVSPQQRSPMASIPSSKQKKVGGGARRKPRGPAKFRSRIDEYHLNHQFEAHRRTAGTLNPRGKSTHHHHNAVTKASPNRKTKHRPAKKPRSIADPLSPRVMTAPPLSTPTSGILRMLRGAIESRRTLYGHTIEDTRSLFQAVDTSGSGRIDAEDVQYALQRLGIGITPLQAEDLVSSMSEYNDGYVNYVEFSNALHERDAYVPDVQLGSSFGKMPMRPATKGKGHGFQIMGDKARPRMIKNVPQLESTALKPGKLGVATTLTTERGEGGMQLQCCIQINNLNCTEISLDLSLFGTNRPLVASVDVGFPDVQEKVLAKLDAKTRAQHLDLLSRFLSDSTSTSPAMYWVSRDELTFFGNEAVTFLTESLEYVDNEGQAAKILNGLLSEGILKVVKDVVVEKTKKSPVDGDKKKKNVPPPTPAQLKATAQATFHPSAIYACANYSWVSLGETEVVRGPDYIPRRTIPIQFRGDPRISSYCDGLVVAANVRTLDKEMAGTGPSSPRSPVSARNNLLCSVRVALSDVLNTKAKGAKKDTVGTSTGTLYAGMSETRLVGFRASVPLSDSSPTEKDPGQDSSHASYDYSSALRTFKLYESMHPHVLPSMSIPSQMLGMYIDRIRELLRIYGNEADPASLEQQRELLGNYLAFEGQLIPSIQKQNVRKSAQLMADVSRQFEATNLHRYCVKAIETSPESDGALVTGYETITMGMPAAHSVGFHQGGLSRLQENYLALRRKAVDGYIQKSEEQYMERLGLQIDMRKDICLSQAISGLTNAFIGSCRQHAFGNKNVEPKLLREDKFKWWSQLYKAGFLAHFECLSGTGDKEGVVEDAIVAIRALDRVVFTIVQDRAKEDLGGLVDASGACVRLKRVQIIPAESEEHFGGGVGKIHVEVYLGSNFDYTALPQAITEGQFIPVRPVMTCQTLDTASTPLMAQELANAEGLEKIIYYCSLRRRAMGASADENEVDELINALEECHRKQHGVRDVSDIYTWLLVSERIARLLGGARITCCSDGKDLSVMASTLEIAVLMRDNHKLNQVENVANALRTAGASLLNQQQNTFKNLYKISRTNMPRLYRPPMHLQGLAPAVRVSSPQGFGDM